MFYIVQMLTFIAASRIGQFACLSFWKLQMKWAGCPVKFRFTADQLEGILKYHPLFRESARDELQKTVSRMPDAK